MNSYIFTDPKFRPRNLANERMPNSYLQFFLTQTTTPHAVYGALPPASSLGAEVTADSDGVFPVIYMDPDVTYRVMFFNEDDELQFDVDPYTPPRDYPTGTVMWFYGTESARDIAYPPTLWQVLDGTNGTPDGRDRVPMFAGGTYAAGDTGGAATTETEPGGAVVAGVTGETILDATNMPVHHHRLYVRLSSTLRGNTHGFGFSGTAGLEGQVIDDAPYGYLEDAPSGSNQLVEDTGAADPEGHTHTTPAIDDHTHAIAGGGLPPFLALWGVMRRAV